MKYELLKGFAATFFAGVMVGCLAISVLVTTSSNSYHSMAKLAKEQCEKSLPRDQKCIVTAIPDPKKEQENTQ